MAEKKVSVMVKLSHDTISRMDREIEEKHHASRSDYISKTVERALAESNYSKELDSRVEEALLSDRLDGVLEEKIKSVLFRIANR